ncbi:unnamed protein product [Peniophora sp. CBMAI 1063]|nr:unnamed protein product [Peniophora sp. CBMAI 1063]
MTDPSKLRDDDKMRVLRHLFHEVGEICFKAYKLRGTAPRQPVDLDVRWWAVSPEMAAFEKAKEKALNARPIYRAGGQAGGELDVESGGAAEARGRAPDPATSASAGGPAGTGSGAGNQVPPREAHASRHRPDRVLSLYGSSRKQRVHNEASWQEDKLIDPPPFLTIADPDDYLVKRSSAPAPDDGWPVPASVPGNGEARAQWAYDILDMVSDNALTPGFILKRCITLLAELPLVRNHGYPLTPFRKHKVKPTLPKMVDWKSTIFRGPTTSVELADLQTYLRASPWTFEHQGSQLYCGNEMAWCFILAFLMYLRYTSSSTGPFDMDYGELKGIGERFKRYLEKATSDNAYPGISPSRKYEIASSRLAYLCTVFDMHYELVQLLGLVQHMPDHTEGSAAVTLAQMPDFPSWQSPRLGLPLASHQAPDIVHDIKTWLSSPNLFVTPATGLPISREIALKHLLLMACLLADLQSIANEDWDQLGHLERSELRGSEGELLSLLFAQADSNVDVLQKLGLEKEVDLGDLDWEEDGGGGGGGSGGGGGGGAEGCSPAEARDVRHRGAAAEDPRGTRPVSNPSVRRHRKHAESSRPAPELLEAARRTNRDGNRLQEFLHHATTRPNTQGEVNQQLAFELHARERERMAHNREVREQSQAEKRQHPTPRTTAATSSTTNQQVPELPPPVDFTLLDDATITPAPQSSSRKRKQPTYHQPIQQSSRASTAARTGKSTHPVSGVKSIDKAKPKRKKKAPSIGRPKKRPRPSARKRAEEPDEQDTGRGSDNLDLLDSTDFDGGPSDTENSEPERDEQHTESDENANTDTSEHYAPRPTKRRRLNSNTSAAPSSTGKPPSKVVEVLLTPRKRVSASPAPAKSVKPRPRPKMVRKPKPVLKPSSATGSTRRSQTPGKTVHFDTPVSTPRRSSRLSGEA